MLGPFLALHRYGVRAQRYSVFPKLDQASLVDTAPVGERTDLYVVYYLVPFEVIRATISEESLLGFRFLIRRAAQKISTGDVDAVRTHYGHEHVAVRVVRDVPLNVPTEGAANIIVFDSSTASRATT